MSTHFLFPWLRNIAFSLSSMMLFASMATASMPKIVNSPIDHMYIPTDYDDNDNIEVIVFGYYPNSCYKTGPISHKIDNDTQTIKITASSYLYEAGEGLCADIRIPFTQKIQLGFLQAGQFKVEIADSKVKESSLNIKEHQVNSSDDHLYAPVESVRLASNERESNQPSPDAKAVLYGRYPRMLVGCMVMRKIQVTRERDDIVVVRPIAEIVDGEACDSQTKLDFKVEVALPQDIPNQTLVHVRATNGNALNQIYLIDAASR